MSHFLMSGRLGSGQPVEDDYIDLSPMNEPSPQRTSYSKKTPDYEAVEVSDLGERRLSQVARKPVPSHSRVDSEQGFTQGLLKEQPRGRDGDYGGRRNGELRVSQWGIGWKTPTLMVTLYLLSLMTAVTHYLMMRHLDGRRSDGHKSTPQQYVTVASILISNVFRAALGLSLSIAFTQYMWHVMRTASLKVSTIEYLYGVRHNFLLLLYPEVIRATPVLFLIAGLIWMIQIAAIYPPGALTIVPSPFESLSAVSVPGFNASTMQEKDGDPASVIVQLATVTSEASSLLYDFPVTSLQRVARQVLTAGEITRDTSPCGANCTYITRFEGPYMKCSEPKSANISMSFTNDTAVVNSEGINYLYNGRMGGDSSDVKSNTSTAVFEYYTSRIVGFYPRYNSSLTILEQPGVDGLFIWESTNVTCAPWRANYTVNTTWTEGTRLLSYSTIPTEQLSNIRNAPTLNQYAEHDIWARDVNLLAIFESLVDALSGNYSSLVSPLVGPSIHPNATFQLENGTVVDLDETSVMFQGEHWDDPGREFGPNGTIIGDTRFNLNADIFVPSIDNQPADPDLVSPKIKLTADGLNDALFNITMSTSLSTDLWPHDTFATILQYHNTYSFSHPKVLLLPYGLSLLVSIPFLLLGGWALRNNGVSAVDGGIMQLLCTTTGSSMVDRTAAAGCLGGEDNVPRELADMRIRFGEIAGSGSDYGMTKGGGEVVKRAGFGREDEIVPLTKGGLYGCS